MKKFIATAALVAASTALASAATVVFTTASSVSGATETVALVTKSSATGKQTLTFTSSTTFSGASSSLSLGYYISGGRDYVANTPSSTNSNTALNTAFTEATGLSLSDFLGSGSKFYGSGGGGSTAKLTFSGLKANTEYRFSFVGAGKSSAVTLSIGSEEGSTTKVGEISDTTRGGGSFYGALAGTGTTEITSSSATATLVSNGDNMASASPTSAATFVVTSNSEGKVIFQTSASAPQFLAIAVSDVIPEPSAFGLLAGIGALALAVSRRKRSRR